MSPGRYPKANVMPDRPRIEVQGNDEAAATPVTLRGRLRRLGPWGSSLAMHAIILIVLVLCKIPFTQTGSILITAFAGMESGDDEFSFFVDETNEANSSPAADATIDLDGFQIDDVELIVVEPQLEIRDEDTSTDEFGPAPNEMASSRSGGGSIGEAGSVEEAVDQITGGIQGRLENGDVLVVWLLDSSLSLQEDRQRIAHRLDSFLKKPRTDSSGEGGNRLLNAVVTFGAWFS